jgi:PPOX class probable FMN-dependent enzyme
MTLRAQVLASPTDQHKADHMSSVPFPNTIATVDQLADHYRAPSDLVLQKDIDHIDEGAAAFIAGSTFVLIGTSAATGEGDVSPKGGDPGFVRVLDDKRLVIPDLNGNNRIDSIRNIVTNSHIGLLFLVPERLETLRVNGRAWISVDDELLDSFTDQYRRPTSAICVEVTDAFIHCGKCVRRGGLWDPESWGSNGTVPSSGTLLIAHAGIDDIDAAELDERLPEGYARDLTADRPL